MALIVVLRNISGLAPVSDYEYQPPSSRRVEGVVKEVGGASRRLMEVLNGEGTVSKIPVSTAPGR